MIPLIAGVLLAVAIAVLARVMRFEQDRSFYPTILIIIASYYILFAILGGSEHALLWELVIALAFSAIAIFGSLRFPLLVGAGIAAHGLFDLVHHVIIQNPGVPSWWPTFCASVDLLLGAWVMGLYYSRRGELLRTSSGG